MFFLQCPKLLWIKTYAIIRWRISWCLCTKLWFGIHHEGFVPPVILNYLFTSPKFGFFRCGNCLIFAFGCFARFYAFLLILNKDFVIFTFLNLNDERALDPVARVEFCTIEWMRSKWLGSAASAAIN